MTSADGYALGVDLGTSNTVAMLRWPDGRSRPLLFDGVPVMPSAVYLDNAGALHVGRDAQRMATLDPSRLEPNPKRRVDEATVLLGDREVRTVDLLAAVLGAVARAAVEATGFLPPAALTYPATWGASRRTVLATAVQRAGWPPVRFVPEPVAAARYFADVLRRPVPVGSSIGVFDFGGGTLDIAVVRNEGNGFVVLGAGGIEDLGGLDVDSVLVDHLGRLLADTAPGAWSTLRNPDSTAQLRDRGRFWEDVRGAKEMLSRTASAPIPVPGLDQAIHLTREELDRVAGPLMQRAVYETAAVIRRCGLRPDQLAGLFLVGGSSRLPIVARLLHSQLGIAPTVLEQPELPVAEGAVAELVPPMPSPAMASAPPPPVSAQPVTGPPVSGPPVSGPPVSSAPGPSGSSSPVAPPFAPPPFTSPSPSGTAPSGAPQSGGLQSGVPHSFVPPPFVAPSAPTEEPVTSGMLGYAPGQQPPPSRPWYRRRLTWIVASALVVVLAAAGTAAAFLWNPNHEAAFVGLTELERVPMGVDSVSAAFSSVNGDRAYLVFQKGVDLHVTGYDLAGRKRAWDQSISPTGATSATWDDLVALPDAMIVTGSLSGGSASRALFGIDWAGHHVWRHDLGSSDTVLSTSAAVVVTDTEKHQLIGLDPRSGSQKWALPNIDSSGDTTAKTFRVFTVDDLASTGWMPPDGPVGATSDTRLVQLSADSSARVIDTTNGQVKASHGNVGDPQSYALTVGGRFYVAGGSGGYKLVSYDLTKLDDDKLVYAAADDKHEVAALSPCGGHACLLDQTSSDAKTNQLIAVNPGGGKPAWRRAAPNASVLIPLADALMVEGSDSSNHFTIVVGEGGKVLLNNQETGVRVTPGSILTFADSPSTSTDDESLTGYGIHSGSRTPLGQLKAIRAANCGWNAQLLVCPSEKDFGIWRFAS